MTKKISNLKQRIQEFVDYKGFSGREFYKQVGWGNGVLRTPGGLTEDSIQKFIQEFPEVSTDWLFSGEGSMLKLAEPKADYHTPIISQAHGVPYYDVDFVGGFDLIFNSHEVNPAFFIDLPPFNDADCWVNVTGKSMSPFISHGDLVALKKMDTWAEFLLFGEIYAIITEEYRTIKIVGQGQDADHYTLIPYSKSDEFSRQPIPKSMIRQIFQVKGSIKKFF